MRIRTFVLALSTALLVAAPKAAMAQSAGVERLAEYPSGTFLENLDVLQDGRVVFTSYFAKTIEVLDPAGRVRTLASVSAHPVSILATDGGYLVAAHGEPFVSGPRFVETQQLLLLDPEGRELATFKAPDARFLNGMVRHVRARVLVADSIAATIWEVDPQARTVTPWLKDAALSQDPAVTGFRPGANGIKRQGDRLVVSNSSRGTLSTIAVDANGAPAGPVALLAQVGPIDDFLIGPGAEIIFATHGPALKRRAPDGTITTILATGCDGCTAVALWKGRDGSPALIVLTTGGLREGGKEPARVLRLPYPTSR